MEVKKYKPEFVLDYLYKNRKKYNKYFQNKMKDINKYRIFHTAAKNRRNRNFEYLKYIII